jgi:hypothetical protein
VPVDLVADLPVELRQHPVARDLEEHPVEGGVRLEEALDVVAVGARAHLVDQPPELREVVGRQLRHREPDGHHLEGLAHLVGLEELLGRQ